MSSARRSRATLDALEPSTGKTPRVTQLEARARRAGVRPGMTAAQASARLSAGCGSTRRRPRIAKRAPPRWPTSATPSRRAWTAATAMNASSSTAPISGSSTRTARRRSRRPSRRTPRGWGWGHASRSRRRRGWRAWRRARTRWRWSRRARPARGRFLAPLPVELLTDEADLRAAFRRWGTRTAGAIAALPADAVGLRLGPRGRGEWRASRAARTTSRSFRSCHPTRSRRRSISTTRSTRSSRWPSCCAGCRSRAGPPGGAAASPAPG